MALLARILKARPSPAAGRTGLLGGWDAGQPRLASSGLSARARAEDKGAGRPGASQAGGRAEGPRSLAAMPGPRTLANLVEFFGKDGFSRIHEIQVAARGGSLRREGAGDGAPGRRPGKDASEGSPGSSGKKPRERMPGRERRGRVPGEDPWKRAGEGTSGGGIEEGRPKRKRREGFPGGAPGRGL